MVVHFEELPWHISVVVPILDEASGIDQLLDQLLPLAGPDCSLMLIDGGSTDGTVAKVLARTDRLIQSAAGRAQQMAAGVQASAGNAIWFLHADTRICPGALDAIRHALRQGMLWGRFDVRLSGGHFAFRIIERAINIRSGYTGICTGDQGIFVTKTALSAVGGVPLQALMEDIELSKRLKRLGRPARLTQTLTTSSRRWERAGIVRVVLLMWWLRLCYFLGVAPTRLARFYYGDKATNHRRNPAAY